MTPIFEELKKHFAEGNWKYSIIEGRPMIQWGMSGQNGNWTCLAHADDKAGILQVFSTFPVKVNEAKRQDIAEFVTRANYGIKIGKFEMDYSDGEIRYQTGICVKGSQIDQKMIQHLIGFNLTTIDRYYPGLMGVIYGNKPVADTVEEIEGGIGGGIADMDIDELRKLLEESDEEEASAL